MQNVVKLGLESLGAVGFLMTAPAAHAASMINPNGSVTLGSGPADSQFQFSANFDGFGANPAQVIPGLSALMNFTYLGTSNGGKTFNFDFTINNMSALVSRITVFGFDVDPNVSSTMGTGLFDVEVVGPNATVPNFGAIDVCFKMEGQTNNCNSGQEGVARGGSTTGTLKLNYQTAQTNITLSRFMVRYQGVDGSPLLGQGGSAVGRGIVTGVPEPSTWGLLIVGFGVVGAGLRHRRKARGPEAALG